MQIQRTNGYSFKGLQCHPNYDYIQYIIATKLGAYSFDKTMKCVDALALNKTPADIYLGGNMEAPKIYVDIAGKTLKENFFRGPYSIVKKALKISNKLDKAESV